MKITVRLKSRLAIFALFFFTALFMQAMADTDAPWEQAACGNLGVTITPPSATPNQDIQVSINISNNQCEMSSFGFDLYFDPNMFTFLGISGTNTLTADWSMLDGNEITDGQVRIGGYSGSGSIIQPSQNGTLIKINFRVSGQCDSFPDGQESIITVGSYIDDIAGYLPQPAQGSFSLICCHGDVSLPADLSGNWGDLVHVPLNVADNIYQVCDFGFDFVFDASVLEIKSVSRTAATQDWSNLSWNPIQPGRIRITASSGTGTCVPASSSGQLVIIEMLVQCVDLGSETSIPLKIEAYADGLASMCPGYFETQFLYRPCPRLGDVNGDGNVTPGDAQAAFEIYLGTRIPNASQLTTADGNSGCTCDGLEHTAENRCITPEDAQWIFEHYLMKRELPICSADYVCPEASASSLPEQGFAPWEKPKIYPLSSAAEPGEQVMVPVMIENPQGISRFGFDLLYPQDLLEFIAVLASPLTQRFECLEGREEFPGVVRIEGIGQQAIKAGNTGSLCLAVFHVKEGVYGTAPLDVNNLNDDLYDAEVRNGIFRARHAAAVKGTIDLGKARAQGGMLLIPVRVTDAFDLKAFGLEIRFPEDGLIFNGIERTKLTRNFEYLDGNVVDDGVLRVGGFCLNSGDEIAQGNLIILRFIQKQAGGHIKIVKATDDLKGFTIIM